MPALIPQTTHMSAKGACLACRAKKVKCVQISTERCQRCTMNDLEECVYEKIKKRGVGQTLRMREACKRCRTRKRKCDAKRPCTACVEANSAPDCEYDNVSAEFRPPGHQWIFWNEPGPSSSEDVSVEERCAVEEPIPTNVLVAVTVAQSGPGTVPPAHALVHSLGHRESPPGPPPHVFDEVRTRNPGRVAVPPFSVSSALVFPRIPREPHLTLSFLGGERLQLSDATLGELDMKFRLRVVCKLHKLGIRFTPRKQQALLRGDTSGAILNPFFIYAAQSVGLDFCEDVNKSPAMIRLQAKYFQRASELLVEIFKGCNWELRAQAALWVTAGSIIMRLTHITPLYIGKSCEAADMAGLQFIPTYGQPPALSEDIQERSSVLSQIIYFENFWFLACGGAEPTMTARIEREFRQKLQKVYPVLFNICPLIMRTQAILLVRDTVVMLALQPTEEDQLEFRRQSCDDLVAHLNSYSQTLLFNLQKFQEFGGEGGADIIRSSCISCLAHLAILCEDFHQTEPAQRELDTLCESALEKMSELTRDVRTEEYTRLDLLLGQSWRKALVVFDARLAEVTPERGTELRRWREAVAEVYSDFVVKLPDAEPTTLTLRAFQLDGRTEGSRYPNLMLPWVWQQLGL